MTRRAPMALLFAGVALVIAAPLVLNTFYISLLSYTGISAIVVVGLVLLTGAGGLTSFGQSAFVGLGAYATAILTTRFGLSPWLGLVAALAVSGLVSIILGYVTLHMSGHYLALLTLAWGMAITLLFGNLEVLGAHSGINDIPALTLFGLSLRQPQRYFYLVAFLLAAVIVGASFLLRSRQGRAIRTLRGGRTLVRSLGIDEFRIRLSIFFIAAVLAGLSGWLYAHMQRYIGPDPFGIEASIEYVLMAVIGGASQIAGALIGAALINFLHSILQDVLPFLTSRAGNLETVVYGCLFILVLHHARAGMAGLLAPLFRQRGEKILVPGAEPLPKRALPTRDQLLLQVSGLTKTFGGLTAVDRVTFDVRAGEIVGMIGPNGAGKTTTFNLISGALRPSQGAITFNGRDIVREKPRNLVRLGMARTFQHVKLRPTMSVLENVMLGAYHRASTGFLAGIFHLDAATESKVRAEALLQLKRVGLAERAEELAGSLPLGQQRSIEIARGLAADPAVLLLDEPAAGLRRFEKEQLSDLLKGVRAAGVTLLLVEHDMEFVMGLVDRIIMLDFGKQCASGTPAEIRADPVVRQAYLGSVF